MYRILIADDEPMALYSTAHAFPWADWGFDPPVLMTEAPAALDKLRTERFDAAIVDIRMPQMTGIDLIRLSGEAGLQTVFIVLSGYSDFSYVQTALRLSTFDYCLKPILPDAAQDVSMWARKPRVGRGLSPKIADTKAFYKIPIHQK